MLVRKWEKQEQDTTIINRRNAISERDNSLVKTVLGSLAASLVIYKVLLGVMEYRRLKNIRAMRSRTRIADSGQGETWYNDLI